MEAFKEITGGDMPEIVFDTTGNIKSMTDPFRYPANGGKLIFVGLVKSDIVFSDPNFHSKELTLMTSRNAIKDDFNHLIKATQSGKINVDSNITHRSKFEHMINTFNDWFNPETVLIKSTVEL